MNVNRNAVRTGWCVSLLCLLCAGSAVAQWSDASTPELADLTPSHGASWADFDNDGDQDLYLANNGDNHLFRNDGDGGSSWLFTDVAPPGTGIGSSQVSSGGHWGDYDNDGDLDLYLANTQGSNHLFRNDPVTPGWQEDPDRTFVDVTNTLVLGSTRATHTCAWVDYDRDGDLDLYMTDAIANILLRNDGADPYAEGLWLFTDVTVSATAGNAEDSQGLAWGDYDDDGDQDIFMANNNGPNALLRNDPETPGFPEDPHRVFTDVSTVANLDDDGYGRGAAWGDLDNDGDLDLYVTNYAEPNLLYRNDGGVFTDISANAAVDDAGNGRGCIWIDFDNDGDQDLHVVNFDDELVTEDSRLYRNDGPNLGEPDGWLFVDVADTLLANDTSEGATACWADYDLDGDLDVYLANWNNGAANVLVRNDHPDTNNYLHVKLYGRTSSRTAIGARVTVWAGGVEQVREINGGEGFHSQGSLLAEFGLGAATYADTLRVEWPRGQVRELTMVGGNQLIPVQEYGPYAPVMYVEPPYTAGTVNTVIWTNQGSSGAVEYEVQAAEDTGFIDLVGTSGWIPGLTHEFSGLADGQHIYFRVRARDGAGLASGWSSTTASVQDDAFPTSIALPVTSPRQSLPFEVDFTASDTGGGVEFVELWYSFDDGVWQIFDTIDAVGPFVFTVPDGVGKYEFYTIAIDFLGNTEAAPLEPDVTVFTTQPDWVNMAPGDGSGVGNDGNGRGAAWGDYDGDGDPDLFITNRPVWFTGADATNHLYRNDGPDGPDSWLFLDTTTGAMGDGGYGQGLAWGDFDGDGDLDLYQANMAVGGPAPNHLFRNDGADVFTDIGPATGTDDDGSARSVAWIDYDQDGDIDLYLCNDGANRLYRNDGENPWLPGEWQFTNVAPIDGTGVGDDRYTMGCAWGDYDNDGDPDLYLSNYNDSANALFRNDGEDGENPGEWLFVNVAAAMGVEDAESGLGCAWGDFDGDGWLDLYVTNQGPNRLYHRVAGSETFEDLASAIGNGLDDGNYSASCAWADYDNDRDLDLYLANHWNYSEDDWVPNLLFRNDGPGGPGGWQFVNDAPATGYGVGSAANTTAACWADFDEDGDLDIYLCNMTGLSNELFRNDVPAAATNNWLHLDLESRSLNTVAVGARVRCVAGGDSMIREVDGGSGFLSQGSLTVEFGLGSAAQADTVEITWPSGIVQTLLDVIADQRLTVMEPGPDIPTLVALPAYTPGDSTVVSWSDEAASGATAYEVQVGDDPTFMSVLDTSGWIPGTTHTFHGLADGLAGYYRVRARDDEMIVTRWSGLAITTQDDSPPVSAVLPIDIFFQGLAFEIFYAAEDTISGLERVDLYYSFDESEIYEFYASTSDGSPFIFDIPDGYGMYRFYTMAEDSVGNMEDPPETFDQSVKVTPPPWQLVSPADSTGIGNGGNGRGAAWGDYDDDGDHDLYITNRTSYHTGADPINHLFLNDGPFLGEHDNWLFLDVTAPPLDDGDYGQGTAWADFDADGDLDLYAVNMQVNPDYDSPNRLFRNDGSGVFTEVGGQTGTDDPGSGRSCSWRDYDQDGDIDLYLCNREVNRLFRNDGEDPQSPGDWIFTVMAPEDTFTISENSYTMACAWGDYDDDGDPDLYLSNFDGAPNRLLRNDGEDTENPGEWLWTDVAPALGLDNAESSMGCQWGDFDNDGLLDLMLSNDGPNALYHNTGTVGNPAFVDIAPLYDIGLDDPQYGAGVVWFDYDNDADLDLYVGNHWNDQSDPAINFLFRNEGPDPLEQDGWLFASVAPSTGFNISDDHSTNGVACADYDEDGDLDLYLATMSGMPNKLFRNDVADSTDNHWLQVDLVSLDANPSAIGATLRCVAGGVSMLREVDGGSGFLSQGSLTVEFGLGSATEADTLEIRWPTGLRQRLLTVAADQRLTIQQTATAVDDPGAAGVPLAFRTYPNYPNPFNPATAIRFDLPERGRVTLSVYALDGSRVVTLVDGELPPGRHAAVWHGRDERGTRVASGLYFYRIQTPRYEETRRMMLVK